jgi:hypothetical protein
MQFEHSIFDLLELHSSGKQPKSAHLICIKKYYVLLQKIKLSLNVHLSLKIVEYVSYILTNVIAAADDVLF